MWNNGFFEEKLSVVRQAQITRNCLLPKFIQFQNTNTAPSMMKLIFWYRSEISNNLSLSGLHTSEKKNKSFIQQDIHGLYCSLYINQPLVSLPINSLACSLPTPSVFYLFNDLQHSFVYLFSHSFVGLSANFVQKTACSEFLDTVNFKIKIVNFLLNEFIFWWNMTIKGSIHTPSPKTRRPSASVLLISTVLQRNSNSTLFICWSLTVKTFS